MRHIWAGFLLCALAQPASAQDVRMRLETAFDGWRAAHDTTGALGTGMYAEDGHWVAQNTEKVNAPQVGELASVSKSVTAVCTLALVEDGRLDWSDLLPALLGQAPDVTVAELVTHTSGLGPDSTQVTMPIWLDRAPDPFAHFSDHVLTAVNARLSQQGTRGMYLYNNENYALLGLVIEAVSARPYWETCQTALDLGIDILPSPRSGAFQPWGGLQAHPHSYITFLEAHYGKDSIIGSDPFALPHIDLGGGAYYGMGMIFRPFRDSFNFWHFGALCLPGRLNVGSFAALWEGEVAALAVYDACVDWPAMGALDTALVQAIYP